MNLSEHVQHGVIKIKLLKLASVDVRLQTAQPCVHSGSLRRHHRVNHLDLVPIRLALVQQGRFDVQQSLLTRLLVHL